MTNLGERIKSLRQERGLSLRELADICETSKSAISMYERGERRPKYETLEAIADAFNVDMEYLLGKSDVKNKTANFLGFDSLEEAYNAGCLLPSDIRPVARKRFPVLGNVACGEPIWAEEERGTFVDGAADIDADFCLIAKGDSMINARIFDGDLLFVKKQPMVEDGEIAVVLVENEATVKRVYYDRDSNVITLIPENPMHKAMRYEGAKLDEITILGKVVAGQFKVM